MSVRLALVLALALALVWPRAAAAQCTPGIWMCDTGLCGAVDQPANETLALYFVVNTKLCQHALLISFPESVSGSCANWSTAESLMCFAPENAGDSVHAYLAREDSTVELIQWLANDNATAADAGAASAAWIERKHLPGARAAFHSTG